jgi:polyisoprenoid-binding protein YceI
MGRARAFLPLLAAASLSAVAGAGAAEQGYTVMAEGSAVRIHVGKTGVFGFAGHSHEIISSLEGTVVADPADLARSSVTLAFDAKAIQVVAGPDEPAQDVPEVQAKMAGPDVLDAARFPTITFTSRSVTGKEAARGVWDIQVTGDLSLHGVSRSLTLPLRVEVKDGTLTATGKTVLRHSDFGMKPVSAGGGTVKVKNEIGVDYRIVARAGR